MKPFKTGWRFETNKQCGLQAHARLKK